MSTIWFTADLHLGHARMARDRGFGDDTDAHDAYLAQQWDARVTDRDTVLVLGDLCLSGMRSAFRWIANRPGTVDLVFGNHDIGHPMHRGAGKHQRKYLQVFRSAQERRTMRIAGEDVLMSHFPYSGDSGARDRHRTWRFGRHDRWLLHGHTHSDQAVSGREIHVGVDAHGLAPVPLSWVESVIRAGTVG